jgi:molecular chaperone DnaK
MAPPVLGIDFGTSNTSAAWVDAKKRVRVVPVREGIYLLPSIAWYSDRGNVLVGDAARQQLIEDPAHTVHGSKRFLGRRWTSPFVHRHKNNFGYRMVEGDDGLVAVELYGKHKSLEDVAVDILLRVSELASASLKQKVSACALTVPAHYGYNQRQTIYRAATRAGLVVKAMVNEPTAAAMYYARKKGEDGTVLIFDLGGGTFDVTVLAIMGGVVRVLATGGEPFLGGQDFDGKVVEHLATRFERTYGVDLRSQTVAMWRLFMAAEAAKVALSTQEETRVRVPCVTVHEDRFLDLEDTLTRRELEELTAPLVERCLGLCEEILQRAKLKAHDVAEIVFVGGQTRMPAIQRRVAQTFHTNPSKHIHPDLGVAVGAALIGQGEQSLIGVVSSPLGVMVPGKGAKELVPANTPVPSVRRLSLGMRPTPGEPLIMALFESPDDGGVEREHLGTTRVDAAWLDQNTGALELEAWIGDDLSLTLALKAGGGGRLPLELIRPGGESAAAPLPVQQDVALLEQQEPTSVDPPGAPARASQPPMRPGGPHRPGFKSLDMQGGSPPADSGVALQTARKADALPPPKARKSPTGDVGVAADDAPLPPGSVVGSYRLLGVIGRGGMGCVYRAEHTLLGRKVALKMLRRRFSGNREAVQRFIGEARAVNQIRHEHIIQITDFLETPDGYTCAIMELLEGKSLAEELQGSGPPGLSTSLRIAHQVSDAMVAVHDASVVHRDLKPENVFLMGKAPLFVKLLDFGVAKLVDSEGRSLHDTGLGEALGTPAYMSPEQLVGGAVDHRADIYALGVVLYEMLTGKRPFDSDDALGDAVYQQLTQRPVPFKERGGPARELPEELEALVLECLEKEADQRPRSMREVRGRLQAVLERHEVLLRSTSLVEPLRPPPDDGFEGDKTLAVPADELFDGFPLTDPGSMDLVLLPGEVLTQQAPAMGPAPAIANALGRELSAPVLPRESRPTPDLPASRAHPRPFPLAAALFAGAALALLVLGGALYATLGGGSSEILVTRLPEPPEDPPPPPVVRDKVRITFSSSPPGAAVHLPGSDRVLGKTPFALTVTPSSMAQDFEFRLAGHDTVTQALAPPTADTTVEVALKRRR